MRRAVEDDLRMLWFLFLNLKNTYMQRNISEAVNQRDHQLSRGESAFHAHPSAGQDSGEGFSTAAAFSNHNWLKLSDERMRWGTNWSWLMFLHAGMWEKTKVINFWFLPIKHVMLDLLTCNSQPSFDSSAGLTHTAHSNAPLVRRLMWSCSRLCFMVFLWYLHVEIDEFSYLYQCARQTADSCCTLPLLNFVVTETYFS